jgi:hypothetical protein
MLRSAIVARSRVLWHEPLLRLFSVLLILSLILLPAGVLAALARGDNNSGFKTWHPSMRDPVMSGVQTCRRLPFG